MMTFEQFQTECLKAAQEHAISAGWRLTFREADYGREWIADAWNGKRGAIVTVYSASAPSSVAHDVLAQLGKQLADLS